MDQVHDMMDDIAEQQDVAKEISDAISNPVAFGQDLDEDELEQELDDLAQEGLDKELLTITKDHELPDVPATAEPVAPAKTSELSNLLLIFLFKINLTVNLYFLFFRNKKYRTRR